METGVTVKNKLEVIDGGNGELTWLFTTKAPIRNRDREVVAAVTVSYAGDRAALRAYDDVVRMAARGISRALGYEGTTQRRATA